MSISVTVIDYKAGNLTSVVKALRYLGAEVTVTDRPSRLNPPSASSFPVSATSLLPRASTRPALVARSKQPS
jgi:hypothetical protein